MPRKPLIVYDNGWVFVVFDTEEEANSHRHLFLSREWTQTAFSSILDKTLPQNAFRGDVNTAEVPNQFSEPK